MDTYVKPYADYAAWENSVCCPTCKKQKCSDCKAFYNGNEAQPRLLKDKWVECCKCGAVNKLVDWASTATKLYGENPDPEDWLDTLMQVNAGRIAVELDPQKRRA